MINLFLKAKHWQLFLLLIGVPILFQMYVIITMFSDLGTHSGPNYMIDLFDIFPFVMIFFMMVFFGWFWSIVFGLHRQIPPELKLNTGRFKIFFFFPLIYMILFMINMSGIILGRGIPGFELGEMSIAIIIPLHLFSMFCIFYVMYFVAKTIRTAELGRKVGFGDYAGEFFLLWIYFVGVWIIQPKVNRLAEKNNPN